MFRFSPVDKTPWPEGKEWFHCTGPNTAGYLDAGGFCDVRTKSMNIVTQSMLLYAQSRARAKRKR